jgi:hypothetical protein
MSEQLTGRELDAALARALGYELKDPPPFSNFKGLTWRKPNQGAWCADGVPAFSTDLNAMHEVEAEIERRGLTHEYIAALYEFLGHTYQNLLMQWYYAHATAEQRARAALAVLTAA